MSAALTVIPAIDIVEGRAVRPRAGALDPADAARGGPGRGTGDGDPLALAAAFVTQGARWLHVADLDRAFGRGDNAATITEIVTRAGVPVQVSGGVGGPAALAAALGTGAARVHLATQALADPEWVRRALAEHAGRLAVCLDCRAGRLAPRGAGGDLGDWRDAVAWLDSAGCERYVVTDVDLDGAMAGPPVDLLRAVRGATPAAITASGGVSGPGDLAALRALAGEEPERAVPRPDAVIVGKALYVGALTLPQALSVQGAGESRP